MSTPSSLHKLKDPLVFIKVLWPDLRIYIHQREITYSVRDNDLTVVPAGNMLGKDWISGLLAVCAFLAPWLFLHYPGFRRPSTSEVRIVTTSVKDDHLRVLWGEIGRFIQTCKYPLLVDDGGPLIYNHRDIRKVVNGKICEISYLRGMVSKSGEGMAGHHAAYTLGIIDEASGVDDMTFTQMETWSKRILLIGNCNPCNNFFYKAVQGGDLAAAD